MFTMNDVIKVSEFLSTKEGKEFFKKTKNSPLNAGLETVYRNSFALQDTFVHVLDNKAYHDVPNWSDSDFEWIHIARTTKPESITRYLMITIENMGYNIK